MNPTSSRWLRNYIRSSAFMIRTVCLVSCIWNFGVLLIVHRLRSRRVSFQKPLWIASFLIDIDDENAEGQEENTRDNDNDNDNLMREEDVLSDDEDEEDYQESIGSVDEDMAAALEQEFLGKQFIAFSSKNEHGKTD